MNVYQKTAFGGFLILLVALSVTAVYHQNGLLTMTFFALVVAVATLPMTWRIIFSMFQVIGVLIGAIAHGIGTVGDTSARWAADRKLRLASPRPARQSSVPGWDELQPTEELDVPSFLQDAMEHQNS